MTNSAQPVWNGVTLAGRRVVALTGEGVREWLQGLLTCDMERVRQERAAYGALLTPQGKVRADFLVVEAPDGSGFWVDMPADGAADFTRQMALYRLRRKIEITVLEKVVVRVLWRSCTDNDVDDEISLAGSVAAGGVGVLFADPRLSALGIRWLAPADALWPPDGIGDVTPASVAAWTAHRLRLGVPEVSSDFMPLDMFPHDIAMDDLGGIDFKKGCYVGQEVVSRMHHRGTARRRPVKISSVAPLPGPGAGVDAGGKKIGVIGNTVALAATSGSIGLAVVRLDRLNTTHNANAPITVDGIPVSVEIPLWATFACTSDGRSNAARIG